MAKEIKLSIKNKQLAEALNLDQLKNKLNNKKEQDQPQKKESDKVAPVEKIQIQEEQPATLVDKPTKKLMPKPVQEAPAQPDPEPVPPIQEQPRHVEEIKKVESPIKSDFHQDKRAQKKSVHRFDRPIKIRAPIVVETKTEPKPAPVPKAVVSEPPRAENHHAAKKQHDKWFEEHKGTSKTNKSFKEYQDLPPLKKTSQAGNFDSRVRHGLISPDEGAWVRKKKRLKTKQTAEEDTTIRPATLKIRVPVSIKSLAAAMKLKTAQLITVLFKQGLVLTLNDVLDDETTIQLLGHEFNCEIEIDTTEQDKIQITDQTLDKEISDDKSANLIIRPPVVTFMGHVDHGKTSLIDAIRKSNRVAYEAGAITQHIGAFQCKTSHGLITILDTPGHEAFSAMRSRGAHVTDIVILVVAGDEGIKEQTIEALNQAKAANVTIIVALNKSDKENFDPEPIYRGLSDQGLIPEQWGGSTIIVNCSAKTGAGISDLLELVALQSEVLELKANPTVRARGTVLESEIQKGMGGVATLLVQNGTLNVGDAVVFDHHYARIKTMINDIGQTVQHAPPSTPIEITGMSGLPDAGSEFIVVKSEKEAKEISEMRSREFHIDRLTVNKAKIRENFLENKDTQVNKKILNLILRADVQGSLEAVKQSLKKIESKKIDIHIVSAGVGEVTESDIQLAKTSNSTIIGFHTYIESHAEELMKSVNVTIKMPKIIYEAVDQVKELMINKLDKVAEEIDKAKIEIKAIFKASRYGKIAGCTVLNGLVARNHKCRLMRNGKEVWKGAIASLKREKDDVKEVKKGMECGIVLDGYQDFEVGDIIESFEVIYHTPTL